MVDLGDGHIGTLEEIETKVIKDQSLNHHRCAANDEDIEAGKVACQPFQRFDKIVIPLVRLLNPEKDHEDRKHKGDSGTEQCDADGGPDAGQQDVLALDAHVDHRGAEALRILFKLHAELHGIDKLQQAAIQQCKETGEHHEIREPAGEKLHARRAKEGAAVALPVGQLDHQSQRTQCKKAPENDPAEYAGEIVRQKAEGMGLSGQKTQTEQCDQTASQIDIGVVPGDEIALGGSIHACTSFTWLPGVTGEPISGQIELRSDCSVTIRWAGCSARYPRARRAAPGRWWPEPRPRDPEEHRRSCADRRRRP